MSRSRAHRLCLAVSLSVGLLGAANARAGALPTVADGQPLPSLAPMLDRVTPAVVNIAARGVVTVREHPFFSDPFFQRFFDVPLPRRQREVRSVGSGVIVDARSGYVVTNHHVIAGAQEIGVVLRDGRQLEATLVGTDPATDVAVLQIPAERLVAVSLADSDTLRVGDFVVAIGNPFGLGQTVTSGIVSALGRSGLGVGNYEDFIQTDASINEGNSGGALVNLRGELVGINSAIFARGGGNIGIGFAIPTNMVRDVLGQLVMHGEVRRGLLGIATQDLTPELAQAFGLEGVEGAVVVQVQPDSEAADAGLQAGDVVTEINGRRVRRSSDLRNIIGLLSVGETARLRIVRDGRSQLVDTQIGERASHPVRTDPVGDRLAGALFTDVDAASPLHGRVQGAVVSEVEPGSAAARHGLRKGDVVLAVNRMRVRNVAELQEAVAQSGRALMLRVQRGSGSVFILIH